MSILIEEIIQRVDQLNQEELVELEQTLEQRAKPGEESLRLVRVLEATRWQKFLSRLGKITRKTLIAGVLIAVVAVGVLLLAFFLRTETVSTGSRKDQHGAGIGYTLEQHRYRDRSRIVFYDGGDGEVVCDLSPMNIDRLVEERWLANGRAIYMHLFLKSPEAVGADGKPEPRPAKVIYDFHRGELYVASPLHLWRTASSEGQWMNDEEFAGLLARYNQ
jgi:hypothetical protein